MDSYLLTKERLMFSIKLYNGGEMPPYFSLMDIIHTLPRRFGEKHNQEGFYTYKPYIMRWLGLRLQQFPQARFVTEDRQYAVSSISVGEKIIEKIKEIVPWNGDQAVTILTINPSSKSKVVKVIDLYLAHTDMNALFKGVRLRDPFSTTFGRNDKVNEWLSLKTHPGTGRVL